MECAIRKPLSVSLDEMPTVQSELSLHQVNAGDVSQFEREKEKERAPKGWKMQHCMRPQMMAPQPLLCLLQRAVADVLQTYPVRGTLHGVAAYQWISTLKLHYCDRHQVILLADCNALTRCYWCPQ